MLRSMSLPILNDRQIRRLSSRSTWRIGLPQLRQSPSLCAERERGNGKRLHPFEVGPHSVDLSGINGYPEAIVAERLLGVVEAAEAIPVRIVRDLWFRVSVVLR